MDEEAAGRLPAPLRSNGSGYVTMNVPHPVVEGRYYTLGLHRWVLGVPYGKPVQVDHINHDPLDNRRSNLRETSASGNQQNRKPGADSRNVSGLPGVGYRRENADRGWAPWYGRKKYQGKSYRTGYFHTPTEAYEALQIRMKGVAP